MGTGNILQQIIDVHGGIALWRDTDAIEADISAWGLLFTIKHRPMLSHVRVTAMAHEPRFVFHEFPAPGMTAELIGNDEVRISGSDGKVVARRLEPRSAMRGLRCNLYWDALDFIYFGGYAMWNYLLTPFLFLYEGVQCELLEPAGNVPTSWARLQVNFPDHIPTHCRRQIFYFDENRHLRRLDYTAEVVGHWAHAAHLCEDYREFGGLKAPTRRRVLPLLWGSKPLPGPTLVALDINDMRPRHSV